MELPLAVKCEIEKIQEVASCLWQREWAERNAGNISFNFTGFFEISRSERDNFPFIPCPLPPGSAGMILFVSGTGERLRGLINKPEEVACMIAINAEATGYHIIWGAKDKPGMRPTSEFVSHLTIHLFNSGRGNNHRCVVHTHPIELIALSHHPVLGKDEEAFNRALWSMLPEIRVFVPRGISLAPYALPGSESLAELTIRGLANRDVILWSKHGALATGKDATEAFDYLDVANKGAKIYLTCLQAGYTPVGLSDDEMKGLEIFF